MDASFVTYLRELTGLLKEARAVPIPKALTSVLSRGAGASRRLGRVLPPARAGSRLASGAPPLPSHMQRARMLMKDEKIRQAAQSAAGGELKSPEALLAMGLRGSGGRAGPALERMGSIAKMPKQTVQEAIAAKGAPVEGRMARFAQGLAEARKAQLARAT